MPRANSTRSQSAEEAWAKLGDDLVFHRVPVDSEDLIVAFSARPIEPGRFHFFSLTDLFPTSSKLLVRDPSRSWYNAGLPGVGETVEEIAAWLRDQAASFGARRVIATGPSMGGYAAILFGCMIGAERVVAISPQTLLDPALRWMMPPAELTLQVPDLAPVIRDAPETTVDVVFGWGSMLDTYHAQRVATAPSVRLLSVRGGHDLARELSERERLWSLIEELIDGRSPSDCEVDPDFDPELLPTLRGAILAAAGEDWSAGAAAAALLAERCPDWPTARVAHTEMLSRVAEPVSDR
ncbi:MAG TPA: hypothetical protein VFM94_11120 [Solirubrobacterales bacterium]|nr:hypothetical protein [Solirubrobacterales bacterium]